MLKFTFDNMMQTVNCYAKLCETTRDRTIVDKMIVDKTMFYETHPNLFYENSLAQVSMLKEMLQCANVV